MLCPKCGAQLSDSAVICRACGAMLPEQPVAPKANDCSTFFLLALSYTISQV